MNAQAKTINLLLYDGNLGGVISIEDSSWNSGELYSAPRESIDDLLKTDACKKYGVYLLLSSETVYVGQSSDLSKRITQHKVGKDWWDSVVILTTKDDSLNHSDIDYLESVLIDKAQEIDKLDCDNKKRGNPAKVDKFRKVYLGQYLEEALFLLQLIGINVFVKSPRPKKEKKVAVTQINATDFNDTKTKLALGKRAKREAIQFLEQQGIKLPKKVSYAVRQTNRAEYWANPKIDVVSADWFIILNDNVSHTLTLLKVPADSIAIQSVNKKGLFTRKDRPDMIDLNITVEELNDKRSKIDFSPYIINKIPY